MDLCCTLHHHRPQVHSCLAVIFNIVCRGTNGPAPGGPPACSSLPLVFAGLLLSHILSPLFPSCKYFCVVPVFLLNMLFQRCYHCDLSLGWYSVCLGGDRDWLCRTWGKFLPALQRSCAVSPPAIKTLPHKPNAARFCCALGF